VPAKSTIHAVLDRHGLVKRGGGPRHRARGTPLSEGAKPNDLWKEKRLLATNVFFPLLRRFHV
jgi:hypothetical protein